jgi:hypothetical protein
VNLSGNQKAEEGNQPDRGTGKTDQEIKILKLLNPAEKRERNLQKSWLSVI